VANALHDLTAGASAQAPSGPEAIRDRLSDAQSLDELTRLFPVSRSVDVQRAIAAVFIRSDLQQLRKPEMVRVLSENRLKSPTGGDIIDILIRRLQTP
jgi:hypothetical protein